MDYPNTSNLEQYKAVYDIRTDTERVRARLDQAPSSFTSPYASPIHSKPLLSPHPPLTLRGFSPTPIRGSPT